MAKRIRIYKEEILQVGVQLMIANGYLGTSIKDITNKLGIPKGSFYNHFQNKEQFALAVLDSYLHAALTNIDTLLNDPHLPPIERMTNFFQTIIDNQDNVIKYKYGCLLGNFCQELADNNPVFRKAIKAGFTRMNKSFARCIQAAKKDGSIATKRSASRLADFLLNGWEGSYLRMKAEGSTRPIAEFRDILFSSVIV